MTANTTDNRRPEQVAFDNGEFYSPEDALRDYADAARELDEAHLGWVRWAANAVADAPEMERCIVEELADTHCPEAAAIIMALPRRFAATVAKIRAPRLQFAGYQARKALRSGRKLEDLTPRMQRAVAELAGTETKAGKELRALLAA